MRLGYTMTPFHPIWRNYTETLREDFIAIQFADRLGFCEAFIGEHVTGLAETITSSLAFIAWLVQNTAHIKLGTGIINLPNRHPAAVAAEVAMVDHMLQGRFIFGIGAGELCADAEVFGNLDADRFAMFQEAIDQILAIWAGDAPYSLEGQYWRITTERTLMRDLGQGVILRPYQRPHPPIAVSIIEPYSKELLKAARHGWQVISANFLQPTWVGAHWPVYQEERTNAGQSSQCKKWHVARSIFVADDEATAEHYVKDEGSPYRYYYRQLVTNVFRAGRLELLKHDRSVPDSSVTIDYVLDGVVIRGTVNRVVEQILAFREKVGDFGTLLYAGHDWASPDLSRRSMELMATEVLPRVNAATGARQTKDTRAALESAGCSRELPSGSN